MFRFPPYRTEKQMQKDIGSLARHIDEQFALADRKHTERDNAMKQVLQALSDQVDALLTDNKALRASLADDGAKLAAIAAAGATADDTADIQAISKRITDASASTTAADAAAAAVAAAAPAIAAAPAAPSDVTTASAATA
jgi:hypothetical protein